MVLVLQIVNFYCDSFQIFIDYSIWKKIKRAFGSNMLFLTIAVEVLNRKFFDYCFEFSYTLIFQVESSESSFAFSWLII